MTEITTMTSTGDGLPKKKKDFRITSIDGGGVRGIIPLQCMAEYHGLDYSPIEKQDMLVGTSVGALIVGCFSKGMSVGEVITNFKEYVPKIFKRNWTWPLFARSKYPITGLEEFLDKYIGETKLGDIKAKALFCTYSTREGKGAYFKSWKRGHQDMLLKTAMRASMAAPLYFPPCKVEMFQDVYLDGGLTGNNDPAGIAYTEAISFLNLASHRLIIESYGCGNHDQMEEPGIASTTIGKVMQVLSALFTCATDNVEQLMKSIRQKDLDLVYTRFNPVLYKNVALDDKGMLDYMEAIARQWMRENFKENGTPSSLTPTVS